jgi:two-component system, OmpR family, phosphate regulon response regulator PhoB
VSGQSEAMGKKTVLIVDDEMDMRLYLSTLLESHGYRPLTRRDGKDGMISIREDRPDLIILDIMMPGDGGVKMYSRLKSDDAFIDIPVIMLSAVAASSFHHFLTMLNAQRACPVPEPKAYLEKPVDHDQLIQLVRDIIG